MMNQVHSSIRRSGLLLLRTKIWPYQTSMRLIKTSSQTFKILQDSSETIH